MGESEQPSGRPPGAGRGPEMRDPVDLEYMPDTSAAILDRGPKGGRFILWTTVAFLFFAALWADYAELDEVTRGEGKVIPSRQLQVIQNLEGGIVSELLVKEGDRVDEGQPLLKIDDVRFSSSFRESRTQLAALQAKSVRLEAEVEGRPFEPPPALVAEQPDIVARERALFLSRQDQEAAKISILAQQIQQREQELTELRAREGQLQRSYDLVRRELNLTKPLVADGAISEVEVLRLERQVNELRGELETTRLTIPRAESRLAEAERTIEEAKLAFVSEARAELNETLAETERLKESSTALEDRVERTLVRSPVRGEVSRLLINTVGGVVQPGMDLVEVVPLEDSLLVEVRIRPSDIGFLHPGQAAMVKMTAYDFAIYGGLPARLEFISADSIADEQGEPYYLVRVRTERNFLGSEEEPLAVIPGMVATVDILTGKKTVLEYLLKPVLRAQAYALRER